MFQKSQVLLILNLIKIATTITDLYHQVAISATEGTAITFKRSLTPIATDPVTGLLSGAKIGIQAAIFASLKTMQLTNIKPNMALMSPIGAAVTAYWGSVAVPGSISPFPASSPICSVKSASSRFSFILSWKSNFSN